MKFLLITICLTFGLQSFSQNDSTYYTLKVRLLKAEANPPHCGVIAWALVQKFEILESNFKVLKPEHSVLLCEPCPEFLGNKYFMTNRIYEVKVTQKNSASFGHVSINSYEKEKLPSFLIQEIKILYN